MADNPALTKPMIRAMRFLATKSSHRARFMQGHRDAYGRPETWTHFEIAGHDARIRMPIDVWRAMHKLKIVKVRPNRDQMFGLSKKGARLFAEITDGR